MIFLKHVCSIFLACSRIDISSLCSIDEHSVGHYMCMSKCMYIVLHSFISSS
jgi:hypothetical protein